ncbi:MFS transporter [Cecembia calidifontis]|uniref:Fucose permease n=1 Tax=Cecembia calidifontis TaxID=1187080 RepID=A0A4V2F755_9BACT|nr:MFS transporter [Cecembia calidifontis]RZS98639.1 fucose permease [Cecembia calidifontis]
MDKSLRLRFLILISFIAFISLGLPDGLLGIAWPFISNKLGIPLDNLGVLLMFFVAGYLSSSLTNSKIMSKISLGWLLAFSCFLTGTSLFGFAVSDYWIFLIFSVYFLGAGGGAIDTLLNIFASAKFSPSVVNWLHAFYGIGATSGPLILTWFFTMGHTWKSGYFFVGSIQISLGILFLLTSKMWAVKEDNKESKQEKISYRLTLQKPLVWLSIVIFFIYTGLEVSVGQWLFTILTKSRTIPEESAGLWVSTFWGSLTIGRILFGFLLQRNNAIQVLYIAMAGIILGAGAFMTDLSTLMSFTGIFLIGFSCAPIFPSMIALVPNLFGEKFAANIIGFQVSAAMIGGAILPAVSGFLTDTFGLEIIPVSFLIQAIFLALSYVFLIKNLKIKY